MSDEGRMGKSSWLMAEREVGNGFKPFRSDEAVGRGPRTRRFPDCSGNSPYNEEQSLHDKSYRQRPVSIQI